MTHKMYCVFARESLAKINGIRGKMASMAGHAYLHAYWDAMEPYAFQDCEFDEIHEKKKAQALAYKDSGIAMKITVVVDTVEELKELQEAYKYVCGTSLVTDAGRTVFKEPTTVCLGIGPISVDNVNDDLGKLPTLT